MGRRVSGTGRGGRGGEEGAGLSRRDVTLEPRRSALTWGKKIPSRKSGCVWGPLKCVSLFLGNQGVPAHV